MMSSGESDWKHCEGVGQGSFWEVQRMDIGLEGFLWVGATCYGCWVT